MTGPLLTIGQAASLLQCSTRTIRRAIAPSAEPQLRAHLVAGRGSWRIRPDDLDAWLEQRTNATAVPASSPAPAPMVAVASRRRGRGAGRSATGVLTVTSGMGRGA